MNAALLCPAPPGKGVMLVAYLSWGLFSTSSICGTCWCKGSAALQWSIVDQAYPWSHSNQSSDSYPVMLPWSERSLIYFHTSEEALSHITEVALNFQTYYTQRWTKSFACSFMSGINVFSSWIIKALLQLIWLPLLWTLREIIGEINTII